MAKRHHRGGPLDFAAYKTPQQAFDDYKQSNNGKSPFTLQELEKMARDHSLCEVCETMPVWRMAGQGMCFTCTTGESDASEDYELELLQ